MFNHKFQLSERSYVRVNTIIRNFQKIHGDVQVYIFGSRARGNAREFSDLDILVKHAQTMSTSERHQFMTEFEESDLPIKVDIVWDEDLFEPYRQQIEQDMKLFIVS